MTNGPKTPFVAGACRSIGLAAPITCHRGGVCPVGPIGAGKVGVGPSLVGLGVIGVCPVRLR